MTTRELSSPLQQDADLAEPSRLFRHVPFWGVGMSAIRRDRVDLMLAAVLILTYSHRTSLFIMGDTTIYDRTYVLAPTLARVDELLRLLVPSIGVPSPYWSQV